MKTYIIKNRSEIVPYFQKFLDTTKNSRESVVIDEACQFFYSLSGLGAQDLQKPEIRMLEFVLAHLEATCSSAALIQAFNAHRYGSQEAIETAVGLGILNLEMNRKVFLAATHASALQSRFYELSPYIQYVYSTEPTHYHRLQDLCQQKSINWNPTFESKLIQASTTAEDEQQLVAVIKAVRRSSVAKLKFCVNCLLQQRFSLFDLAMTALTGVSIEKVLQSLKGTTLPAEISTHLQRISGATLDDATDVLEKRFFLPISENDAVQIAGELVRRDLSEAVYQRLLIRASQLCNTIDTQADGLGADIRFNALLRAGMADAVSTDFSLALLTGDSIRLNVLSGGARHRLEDWLCRSLARLTPKNRSFLEGSLQFFPATIAALLIYASEKTTTELDSIHMFSTFATLFPDAETIAENASCCARRAFYEAVGITPTEMPKFAAEILQAARTSASGASVLLSTFAIPSIGSVEVGDIFFSALFKTSANFQEVENKLSVEFDFGSIFDMRQWHILKTAHQFTADYDEISQMLQHPAVRRSFTEGFVRTAADFDSLRKLSQPTTVPKCCRL